MQKLPLIIFPCNRTIGLLRLKSDRAVHNGGGIMTPPESVFGGDMFYINNDWAYGTGGRIYRVTPDGTRTIFAQGFNVDDMSDLALGPDGGMYVADRNTGVIYEIIPEPATLSLLALGGLAMLKRRR